MESTIPQNKLILRGIDSNRVEVPKMTEENKPVHAERAGAVSVSVFENTNKNAKGEEFTSTSFIAQRAYTKDEGKTWEHTNSFKQNDVPKLIACMQRAYENVVIKHDDDD